MLRACHFAGACAPPVCAARPSGRGGGVRGLAPPYVPPAPCCPLPGEACSGVSTESGQAGLSPGWGRATGGSRLRGAVCEPSGTFFLLLSPLRLLEKVVVRTTKGRWTR